MRQQPPQLTGPRRAAAAGAPHARAHAQPRPADTPAAHRAGRGPRARRGRRMLQLCPFTRSGRPPPGFSCAGARARGAARPALVGGRPRDPVRPPPGAHVALCVGRGGVGGRLSATPSLRATRAAGSGRRPGPRVPPEGDGHARVYGARQRAPR